MFHPLCLYRSSLSNVMYDFCFLMYDFCYDAPISKETKDTAKVSEKTETDVAVNVQLTAEDVVTESPKVVATETTKEVVAETVKVVAAETTEVVEAEKAKVESAETKEVAVEKTAEEMQPEITKLSEEEETETTVSTEEPSPTTNIGNVRLMYYQTTNTQLNYIYFFYTIIYLNKLTL